MCVCGAGGRGEGRAGLGICLRRQWVWGLGPRGWEQSRWESGGRTRGGGRAGAPILAVLPALVQLALVPRVAGLAAALGLPPGVEEAAAAVEALQVTGSRPRGCGEDHRQSQGGGNSGAAGGGPGQGTGQGGPSLPSGGGVGEGTATQVPLSRRFPLGQVQTGPLGLSRQSHSHFLRSQGLVTAGVGQGRRRLSPEDPERPCPPGTEASAWRLDAPCLPAPAWASPRPPSGCLCWWYRTTSEAWFRPPVRLTRGLCPNLWILKTRLLM